MKITSRNSNVKPVKQQWKKQSHSQTVKNESKLPLEEEVPFSHPLAPFPGEMITMYGKVKGFQ